MTSTVETDRIRALLIDRGLVQPGDEARLEALTGGYRNLVFRWRRPMGLPDAVVKVYVDAGGNPLFPTLPDHEVAALALLAGTGLAPELLAFEIDAECGEVLVYEMVPGDIWSGGALDVGGLLRRVHAVDASATGFEFRPLTVAVDELADQADAVVDRVADNAIAARVRDAIRRSRTGARPATPDRCLVHTDPGPGNVIAGPDGLRLIDWQCPGLGDPVEDLAAFASPAIQILYGRVPLTDDEVADLLAGYATERGGNEAVSTAVDRFVELRPVYGARTAAYCAYRMGELERSDPHVSRRYASALAAELALLEV